MNARSKQFWQFQAIFWTVAGLALFISGATQMPVPNALVRNLFLFLAGFLSSFFLAMAIDELRWLPVLRLRVVSYALAYIVALFCVVAINAISYTMLNIPLSDMSFGQWVSGALNLGLIYAFWSELFLQQIYSRPVKPVIQPPERLVVEHRGAQISLSVGEVSAFVAAGDYVEIHCGGKTYLRRQTLQSIEASCGNNQFVRVHRSVLVNRDRVQSVSSLGKGRFQLSLHGDTTVESSRGYKSAVQETFLTDAG